MIKASQYLIRDVELSHLYDCFVLLSWSSQMIVHLCLKKMKSMHNNILWDEIIYAKTNICFSLCIKYYTIYNAPSLHFTPSHHFLQCYWTGLGLLWGKMGIIAAARVWVCLHAWRETPYIYFCSLQFLVFFSVVVSVSIYAQINKTYVIGFILPAKWGASGLLPKCTCRFKSQNYVWLWCARTKSHTFLALLCVNNFVRYH